jgi:hypothetical protein
MEEDDLERAFENDIDNLSDCDSSDGGDFLAESIARLKEEIQNPNSEEHGNDKDRKNEWNQLMESITFTASMFQEFHLPNAERSEINVLENAKPSAVLNVQIERQDNLFESIEILDEVREVLFAMIESVEYIAGFEFDTTEKDTAQHTEEVDMFKHPVKEECDHTLLAEFQEESVAIVAPDTSEIDSSTMLYEDLLRHEDVHKKNIQVPHKPPPNPYIGIPHLSFCVL